MSDTDKAAPPAAGWKLVPIEPTPEMLAAWPNCNHGSGHEAAIYRAMLAAAPPAAQAGDELPPTSLDELAMDSDGRLGSDGRMSFSALAWSTFKRAALAARGAQAGDEREAWIPVTERLPDGEDVLFYSPDLRNHAPMLLGRYIDGRWMCAGYEMGNVTHWKPAPDAPGAKG